VWKTVATVGVAYRGRDRCCMAGLRGPSSWQPLSSRPAQAGTRSEVHPRLFSVSLQLPGNQLVSPCQVRVTGLGRERNQLGQSGRSSRGSHAPPGNQRESGTGRRATGIIVSDAVRTEVRDLMGDPHRDLEHLRKLAQANPKMRFSKLHKIIKRESFLQMVWQKVQTNPGSRTPGIDGQTKEDIDVTVFHTLAQHLATRHYRPQPVRRTYIRTHSEIPTQLC